LRFLQLDQQLFEQDTIQDYLTAHAFKSVTELDWYKDAPEGDKTQFIRNNLYKIGGEKVYYVPNLDQPHAEKT